MENLISSSAGGAIGVYLFAVVWRGNIKELGKLLAKEEGYIEFLIAIMILYALDKYGPENKVTKIITTMAILAVVLRFAQRSGLTGKFSEFQIGKISGFDFVKSLFKG